MLTTQPTATQSPVCLIKTNTGPCNHHWCMMANKHPQYFAAGIEEFYNQHEFIEFDVINGYGSPHLMPHSPTNPEPGFEIFRQSMSAVIHLGGEWPTDLEIVSRDHVEIRWAEQNANYMQYNEATGENETLSRLDVSQLAFYIGPDI